MGSAQRPQTIPRQEKRVIFDPARVPSTRSSIRCCQNTGLRAGLNALDQNHRDENDPLFRQFSFESPCRRVVFKKNKPASHWHCSCNNRHEVYQFCNPHVSQQNLRSRDRCLTTLSAIPERLTRLKELHVGAYWRSSCKTASVRPMRPLRGLLNRAIWKWFSR